MAVSIGLHGLLLLLFVLLLAYREPDPPLPDYGIELNFGLQAAGSGNVQPESPANDNTTEEDAAPEATPETTPEEVVEPVEASQPVTEDVTTPDPQPVQEDVVTQPDASTVKPKDNKPKPQDEVKPDTKPTEDKPKPAETKPEETTTTTGASGDAGKADTPPASNQGNKPDATGDQGDPEGSLDSRALMGTPGGGGGAQLDMEGWKWVDAPKVNDKSTDRGRIVFEISVDDFGNIQGIKTIETTASPAVVAQYRKAVEELTFLRKSNAGMAPPISKGTITFIIKDQ